MNVDDPHRDFNTFATTGRLPTGLPEASAVAFGGGMKASGVKTFSAHLLRHTWATNFMRLPRASLSS